jgi:hypothetical protein
MVRALTLVAAMCICIASPAQAHGPRSGAQNVTAVTFEALVPCAIACATWVDLKMFSPCENPFPPGSYDEVLTAPAPAAPADRVALLEATIDPSVDWDMWLCAEQSPHVELAQGANELGAPCDYDEPPWAAIYRVNCHEDAVLPLAEGERVIMRAFNVADPLPAPGRYWISFI